MTKETHVRPTDIRGYGRLAVEATIGLSNLVETVHQTISQTPFLLDTSAQGPTNGITGLVYKSIRGTARLVGDGGDAILAQLVPLLEQGLSSTAREAVLAALNGVLGLHLAATGNPLTIPMRFRRDGHPLELTSQGVIEAIPEPTGKVLILVHGLCMNDLQWLRKGHDHGAALSASAGFTQVYLHYNSGLHVSTNGRAFSGFIESLLDVWPVPVNELVIVAHSMGGLVARSAFHYGEASGHQWPERLNKLVFLGTPHHGAPLERGGNWVDAILEASPYTAAFARLGKIRGAGITDLRYGNLLDEDWEGRDRFARSKDRRRPVPLPEGVACYAIGASVAKNTSLLSEQLVGDGLVPLRSALGQHTDPRRNLTFPEDRQWIGYGMNHMDLLDRRDVYEQLARWLNPRDESGAESTAGERDHGHDPT